jgi:hypothetical protein
MNLNDMAIPLALVAFAGFWCLVCLLISMLSGWRLLAGVYRRSEPVVGNRWRFQSAAMQRFRLMPSNYGGCLTVIVNEDGIEVSVMWLFRIGHPPLFIPWSDVSASEETKLFVFRLVRLDFIQEPSVAMFIDRRLARRIQDSLGQDWFADVG